MTATAFVVAAALVCSVQLSAQQPPARLFPPADLGLLESPDRAAWQKPDLVMDALRIAENATVADVGAGSGFFTVRLARRVGPNGVVYAEDIQPPMLESIKRRISREGLNNVVTRLGTETDTNLPKGALDAVLVVDVYQEVADEASRIRLLRHLASTIKPQGRIGIVNYKPGEGGPGPEPQRRLDRAVVEAEVRAAGLRVLDRVTLPFQYLLVVGR
ncbi:MAG TPA: class I SAM-dependent methyltransferase [Vicinamibacterales bacterium]|nr:class I SAM-dependent methyltransferase [Vicinamibacterales bacterium]